MAKHNRPRVGINADFVAAGKTTSAHARLHAGYFDNILAAGGLPVILPPLGQEKELDALLDMLDGVVLSGGLDLDPRRWGQLAHAAVQPMAPRREDNDRTLAQRIVARKLPVLAIGVGAQLINQLCGGTTYLHLPEDLPRAMPHRDPTGAAHRHAILVEPGTRLEEIYGPGEIRVNSHHHQAVRLVGVGMRVGARAPDGVIEAIETVDTNWFCVAVQWHPESETASALDMQLFEAFIQACLKQAQSLDMAA
jgi:putative glutamine amidotransferase